VDRITVRDLRVETRVGVTDEERARPQPVVVDIDIDADLSAAGASDELADTVDYDKVVTEVASLLRNSKSRLLEHLAQQIATEIMRLQGVQAVTVEVSKESPPVSEDVRRIGVRVERSAE
jgi:dihydroneopterin aldolase